MATSEIEKLERRYADNPHGLTFAPLAEVHRKNGDVARALELLTAGLELHPNYIPASIVLGRCHQDLGDLPAAEAAFAHVLRLDDENVIALKSLADINERLEHFGEAEDWLRRLVSVDRSNDEAREQLRRLEVRKKEAEVNPEPAAAAAATLEVIDLEPETSPADLPVDLAALELSPASRRRMLAPRWRSLRVRHPGTRSPPWLTNRRRRRASASKPEEPGSAGDAVQPVSGLISAEFQPPLEAIGGLGVETSEDLVLDVTGNTEFRVPDASEDFKALAERMNAPPEPRPARRPEPAPRVAEDASTPLAEPKPAAESPPMEVQPVGMPVTRRSYLARETKGRSVASFFHSLLAARPPSEGGRNNDAGSRSEADASAPARAGQDGGVSGSTGDDNLLVPPAVPGSG